jgi:hypothetical protein
MKKEEIYELIESIPDDKFKPSKGQCRFWVHSVTTGQTIITPTDVEIGDVFYIEQTRHPIIVLEKQTDNLFIVGHLSSSAKDMSFETVSSRFGETMYVTGYGKIVKKLLTDFKYQLSDDVVARIKKKMW